MSSFNQQTLSQYAKELGIKKMQMLWQDFSKDTKQFFEKALDMSKTEIRLKFHNLRSGALVFGLDDFSSFCAKVEQEILQGISENLLEARIKEAQRFFTKQQSKINTYLECHND